MPADGDIDYRALTRAQLLEAQSNIHAARYPRNHANLLQELARREQPGYVDTTTTQESPDAQPNPFPSLVLDSVTLDRGHRWLAVCSFAIAWIAIVASQAYRPMLILGSTVATLALPILLGIIAAFVVGRLLLGSATTQLRGWRGEVDLSVTSWLLAIIGTTIMVAGAVGWVSREITLLAGSMTPGPTRTTDAVVIEIQAGRYRQRCRQYVTIALNDGSRAELCSRPRWRSDIVPYGIAVGEPVRIEVTRNLTGEWVTKVSRFVRKAPRP